MAKSKLATPEWIIEGFDSKANWEKKHGLSNVKKKETPKKEINKQVSKKGKVFKVRKCPKCGSYNVCVVISGQEDLDFDEESIPEGKTEGEWECKDCKWHGENVKEEELNEDEFMKYLDEKGEEVA